MDPTDTGSARPRYCVVGAGATGLAAVEALYDAGLEFDCFETSDRVGGQWHTGLRGAALDARWPGFTGDPMPEACPLPPSVSDGRIPRRPCGRYDLVRRSRSGRGSNDST